MKLSKVTMILRGYTYEQVRCVAEVLLDSQNIRNLEITMNTENVLDIIEKISKEYQGRLNIGAGTVQTYDELIKAIDAGAKFVLSPRMMTQDMINYCKEKEVLSIPGVFTPSEIGDAFAMGADVVKVFPANELSMSYAKKVCEPMGPLPLMAVGGINKENVKDAFNNSYQHVGTAGGLFSKEDIINMNVDNLKASLAAFENQLK